MVILIYYKYDKYILNKILHEGEEVEYSNVVIIGEYGHD